MVCLAEALEMHDLPLPQEADGVVDIRIVAEAEDVVVGDAGLLLCRQILCQIRNHIPGNLDTARTPRRA